jgi:epoxyqueuosine reductase
LSEEYEVTLFFYNPNIYPESEYARRLEDIKKFSEYSGAILITGDYNHDCWDNYISGMESEKEGGARCEKCFMFRMQKTAYMANLNNFDYFASAMSISPHKNSNMINGIGKTLEKSHGILYLGSDFKKKDGFKKTNEISKNFDFYRQSYCGCKYSMLQALKKY